MNFLLDLLDYILLFDLSVEILSASTLEIFLTDKLDLSLLLEELISILEYLLI
jgi:hypothetical protein